MSEGTEDSGIPGKPRLKDALKPGPTWEQLIDSGLGRTGTVVLAPHEPILKMNLTNLPVGHTAPEHLDDLTTQLKNARRILREREKAALREKRSFGVEGSPHDKLTLCASMEIEGTAITGDINRNGWAVHDRDLDMIASRLPGRQIRIAHSNHPRDVIGKVRAAWREGNKVRFRGEISDEVIEKKIDDKLLDAASIQVLPGDFRCAICGERTRDSKGRMIHDYKELHGPLAFEWAEDPDPLELSIVSIGAYPDTTFQRAI